MSLYAIADLHLSLGTDKPMDIFSGWDGYLSRLENNWRSLISENDTVVIAGDISWAMKLENCYNDFKFLNNLPGQKILIKGNHDYWWSTKNKIETFIKEKNFNTLKILFNNSYVVDNFLICGTRGWYYDLGEKEDKKVLNREVGRLKSSLDYLKENNYEKIVFLHYPPVYNNFECKEFIDLLNEYNIKKCYYGHLHGRNTHRFAVNGEYKNINFRLISCDFLNFTPVLVR